MASQAKHHILSVLVENRFGVLTRVAGLPEEAGTPLSAPLVADFSRLAPDERFFPLEEFTRTLSYAWSRRRDLYPASPAEIQSRAETARWTRDSRSGARDGVPAHAFPGTAGRETGRLPQRNVERECAPSIGKRPHPQLCLLICQSRACPLAPTPERR